MCLSSLIIAKKIFNARFPNWPKGGGSMLVQSLSFVDRDLNPKGHKNKVKV